MDYLLAVLALAGLVGCYDIAHRMNARTRHSMRAALLVIGCGCVLALAGRYDLALVALLAGMGLWHAFDRRGGSYGRDDGVAGGGNPVLR